MAVSLWAASTPAKMSPVMTSSLMSPGRPGDPGVSHMGRRQAASAGLDASSRAAYEPTCCSGPVLLWPNGTRHIMAAIIQEVVIAHLLRHWKRAAVPPPQRAGQGASRNVQLV